MLPSAGNVNRTHMMVQQKKIRTKK